MLLETLSGAKPPTEGVDDRRPSFGGDGNGKGAGEQEEEEEEEESEAAKFCTAWLLCVGSATVGCLLAKVRPLPARCAHVRTWHTSRLLVWAIRLLVIAPLFCSVRLR